MIRRIVPWVLLVLLLTTGCTALRRPEPAPAPLPADPPPVVEPQPEPEPEPEQPPVNTVPAGAVDWQLDSDRKLRVLPATGTMPSVRRPVQLLVMRDGTWSVAGEVTVTGMPETQMSFWREDLPGFPGAVVMEARRQSGVRHGAVAVMSESLVALPYHELIAPVPEVRQGTYLFLNKYMNQVWVYRNGALASTYPTANGRDPWGSQPNWDDYKTNYKTPEGLFAIQSKIVNPPYKGFGNHPPADGGAPNNPLGTRWMGLNVLEGDGGGVWGFHGTYVPEQLGTWASEGCIRLYTPHAEAVYDMVAIGTKVRIISGVAH